MIYTRKLLESIPQGTFSTTRLTDDAIRRILTEHAEMAELLHQILYSVPAMELKDIYDAAQELLARTKEER